MIFFKPLFGFFEKSTDSRNNVWECVKAVFKENWKWIGFSYKQELTSPQTTAHPHSENLKHML